MQSTLLAKRSLQDFPRLSTLAMPENYRSRRGIVKCADAVNRANGVPAHYVAPVLARDVVDIPPVFTVSPDEQVCG